MVGIVEIDDSFCEFEHAPSGVEVEFDVVGHVVQGLVVDGHVEEGNDEINDLVGKQGLNVLFGVIGNGGVLGNDAGDVGSCRYILVIGITYHGFEFFE